MDRMKYSGIRVHKKSTTFCSYLCTSKKISFRFIHNYNRHVCHLYRCNSVPVTYNDIQKSMKTYANFFFKKKKLTNMLNWLAQLLYDNDASIISIFFFKISLTIFNRFVTMQFPRNKQKLVGIKLPRQFKLMNKSTHLSRHCIS